MAARLHAVWLVLVSLLLAAASELHAGANAHLELALFNDADFDWDIATPRGYFQERGMRQTLDAMECLCTFDEAEPLYVAVSEEADAVRPS